MATVEPLIFELQYRRECYSITKGKFERLEERDEETVTDPVTGETSLKVPLIPPMYEPLRGSHAEVAKQANILNNAQEKHSFSDYFFFPDVPKMEKSNGK